MTYLGQDNASELARITGAEVIRSFCYTCPFLCPTEVYVKGGKVVYLRGNPASPNNMGARCGKGMAGFHVTRDPDRLKYPMKRSGPKGSGQFEAHLVGRGVHHVRGKPDPHRRRTRPRGGRLPVPPRPQHRLRPGAPDPALWHAQRLWPHLGLRYGPAGGLPDLVRPLLPHARLRQRPLRHAVGHELVHRLPGPVGEPRPDRGHEEGLQAGRRRPKHDADGGQGGRVVRHPPGWRRRPRPGHVPGHHRRGPA